MGNNTYKKILFVIPALAGAGAERVLVDLLTHLNRNTFRPVLVVFNERGAYVDEIPKDVTVFDLKKKSPLNFFHLIHRLSKIIQREQPDLIVSFLTYTNYLTLMARSYSGHNIPVILTEHITLSRSLADERFECVKTWIISRWYPKAERIIAVSQGVKKDLANKYKYLPFSDKISVIYNSIDIEKINGLAREKVTYPSFASNNPVIISAGKPIAVDALVILERN